ncbi:MAG: DNA pilot protein [Arizlama microvirus]|nr:MAG: DNA pilot protein [Arizlama microvirus]
MDPLTMMALAQGVQTGVNYLSQQEANEQNMRNVQGANAMSSSIAQENRDFQYKMWKEQTAYNAPEAQMQRLKAAGLNPNLVYGQIAESKMSSPPSIPMPDINSARVEAPKLDLNIADYQQVKNMQSMNQINHVEIMKRKAEAQGAQADAELKEHMTNYYKRTGLVPGESGWIRNIGRVYDYLKQNPEVLPLNPRMQREFEIKRR